MASFAKYIAATGEITAVVDASAATGGGADVAYFALPADQKIDPALQYISGSGAGRALAARQLITLKPIVALTTEAVTIPMPAGAYWRLDNAQYVGPKTVTFAEIGSHGLFMLGAFRGDTTLTVNSTATMKATVIAAIDAANDARQAANLSPGAAKGYSYSRKAIEAAASVDVLPAVLNALGLPAKKKSYPFALAEAALTGEQLAVVLARYQAAYASCIATIAAIEAAAIVAKANVRKATTAAAVAAAGNVNWPA